MKKATRTIIAIGAALAGAVHALTGIETAPAETEQIRFADKTQDSRLEFRQSYGDTRLDNIVEATGSGVCVFDYNNDGFLDLYFPNGKWTEGVSDARDSRLRGKLRNHLFRNNGDGTFTDVTSEAGVGGNQYSIGCAAGDYDNDGNVDLLVLNYGHNELFHNNGNGKFTEVAASAGLSGEHFSVSAVWLDFDGDGYLDIFIGNYVKYNRANAPFGDSAADFPGPLSYQGDSNLLLHNNGNGTFSDVTREMGVWKPDGRSMGVTASDFDNDGKLELLSANDSMANYYFQMNRHGQYDERALEMNLAYGENGENVAHMGAAVGDLNRDGLLDIFITNLRDSSVLLQRPNGGSFEMSTDGAGLGATRGQYSAWSSALFDFDHDGWLDIFVSNGGAQHEYGQQSTIYRNRHDARFANISRTAGPYFAQRHVGRGGAGLDFDNDGRTDLVLVNLNDEARLLRNETREVNHWITVIPRLRFPTGTRDAFGARVIVVANGLRMVEDMIPTRGYLSAQDPRLNFGLGKSNHADRIDIRWPDGQQESHLDVAADRFVVYTHEQQTRPLPSQRQERAKHGRLTRPDR